ncbi:MAG: diguanylate cyclase [Acidimicrobiales bacterium]|nr:diguanylate cyclase [Acidimicrobiales bacterium]
MIDRRALVALLGAALGVTGAVVAVWWTPVAALAAALGALLAAGVALSAPATRATAPAEQAAPATAPSAASPSTTASVTADDEHPAPGLNQPVTTNGSPSSPLLIDPETGLFSEDYFDVAIEARIAAARRHLRPVGVVVLEVVEGLRTGQVEQADPKRVAEAIQETLREADTSCRRGDGRFALLLEDTPENGAIWTVERIRRFLAERDPSLTMRAGVACYPAHGFTSESLIALAGTALDAAREWHQDRIEVAIGE